MNDAAQQWTWNVEYCNCTNAMQQEEQDKMCLVLYVALVWWLDAGANPSHFPFLHPHSSPCPSMPGQTIQSKLEETNLDLHRNRQHSGVRPRCVPCLVRTQVRIADSPHTYAHGHGHGYGTYAGYTLDILYRTTHCLEPLHVSSYNHLMAFIRNSRRFVWEVQ